MNNEDVYSNVYFIYEATRKKDGFSSVGEAALAINCSLEGVKAL
jgi:hypothetical protein